MKKVAKSGVVKAPVTQTPLTFLIKPPYIPSKLMDRFFHSRKPYRLEIKVNDVEFKTNAKDLETALTKFVNSPVFPVGAKTIAFINYSKGKKKGKKIWQTSMARRMFNAISLKPTSLAVLAEKLTQELA